MDRQQRKIEQANRAIARLCSTAASARRDHRILYWHRLIWRRYGVLSEWGRRPWSVRVINSGRHSILENLVETPPVLAAIDEGIRTADQHPTIPLEEVRRKIPGWAHVG